MDAVKRSIATILTAISIILVVVGILVFSTIVYFEYQKLAPFSYSPQEIHANPQVICAGDNINYNVMLRIRDIGYEVVLHTSFYDLINKETITPVNSNVITETVVENRILLAHLEQITQEPVELQLSYPSPAWLTPGDYSLLRIASISGKSAQYYSVGFKVKQCDG